MDSSSLCDFTDVLLTDAVDGATGLVEARSRKDSKEGDGASG